MKTIDQLNLKTLMTFEKAEALATLLNSEADDMLYECVPSPQIGLYAVACFTLCNGEPVRFEGFL